MKISTAVVAIGVLAGGLNIATSILAGFSSWLDFVDFGLGLFILTIAIAFWVNHRNGPGDFEVFSNP